jgi:hypothetical protein
VRGVTRKLSARETSIVDGFGTTEWVTAGPTGVGPVTPPRRQAASRRTAMNQSGVRVLMVSKLGDREGIV